MTDVLTREQRRRNMAAIRSKDTKPEMLVRSLVHRMGFRFRLHRRDLPGTPDLVFPKLKKIVFIHGCYWHMHHCRYGRVIPKTRAAFWRAKRQSNVDRDMRIRRLLKAAGWGVLVIWECQIRDLDKTQLRLLDFLT